MTINDKDDNGDDDINTTYTHNIPHVTTIDNISVDYKMELLENILDFAELLKEKHEQLEREKQEWKNSTETKLTTKYESALSSLKSQLEISRNETRRLQCSIKDLVSSNRKFRDQLKQAQDNLEVYSNQISDMNTTIKSLRDLNLRLKDKPPVEKIIVKTKKILVPPDKPQCLHVSTQTNATTNSLPKAMACLLDYQITCIHSIAEYASHFKPPLPSPLLLSDTVHHVNDIVDVMDSVREENRDLIIHGLAETTEYYISSCIEDCDNLYLERYLEFVLGIVRYFCMPHDMILVKTANETIKRIIETLKRMNTNTNTNSKTVKVVLNERNRVLILLILLELECNDGYLNSFQSILMIPLCPSVRSTVCEFQGLETISKSKISNRELEILLDYCRLDTSE